MARPISYGLVLDGQDAKDFDDYMANPTVTNDGLELMQKVVERRIADGKTP